jgi:hypothetical protein
MIWIARYEGAKQALETQAMPPRRDSYETANYSLMSRCGSGIFRF